MNGILVIDKPEGLTSHDVVSRLRRILKTKKIGHTGTLDPFATGVLVMLVGKATRLAQFLDKDSKGYEAVVRFGFETDTGDRTGKAKGKSKKAKVKNEEIEKILPEFMGEIEQVPPMYSAKKVKGKKLYELARKGIEIERKAVQVKITELEIFELADEKEEEFYPQMDTDKHGLEEIDFQNSDDKKIDELQTTDNGQWTTDYGLKISCSAGTYIRTLAEDIGRKIGVPCHLAELRRTKAGKFSIEQAVTLEDLEKIVEAGKLDEILVSMNEAISHLPERRLSEVELKRIQNGLKINASLEIEGVQQIRMTDALENLVAIGIYDENEQQIQPNIVFLNS